MNDITAKSDWQDIANEMDFARCELRDKLDEYFKLVKIADKKADEIEDKTISEEFSDVWCECEGLFSDMDDNIAQSAKLSDFIEEKLV